MRLSRYLQAGFSSAASELHEVKPTLGVQTLFLFCATYLLPILYCHFAFSRDPTSFFFDPTKGYQRKYSIQRQHEADTFITSAAVANSSSTVSFNHTRRDPI